MKLVRIFAILGLGVWLGSVARFIYPPPEPENTESEPIEIHLPKDQEQAATELSQKDVDPLIPPIRLAGFSLDNRFYVGGEEDRFDFSHDSGAIFEPHGEQICASGCAASHHPTPELQLPDFHRLLIEFANQPISGESKAFEELLFYGRQTQAFLALHGDGGLDPIRSEILREELRLSHAMVEIQVLDEHGEIRSWLTPTEVPLDRRHVFEMEAANLQPLVTSGTVKRVGLDHLWTRL